MQKIVDETLVWKGTGRSEGGDGFEIGKWESRCRLRIYQQGIATVVIFTDLGYDNGTSITNAAEYIATIVQRKYELVPHQITFVEHYPHLEYAALRRKEPKNPVYKETFDFVYFDWKDGRFREPDWKPGTREAVEAMVGELFP